MKKGHRSETYSEPSQISKMKLFANIVDYSQPLTIFAKRSILGISHCYGYASDKTKQKFDGMSFISPKVMTAISALERY